MTRIISLMIGVLLFCSCNNTKVIERNQDFNFGWKFSLDADSSAIQPDYDNSKWNDVKLPHDWSVEFPFDTINGEGCVGYLPGGVGWYSKNFDVAASKTVHILFDGVYNHSTVWLNGHKLGYHPNGYSPFYYNLSPYLNKNGKNNKIVVKVDRTRFADSRWYSGSGIYRNVKLIVTEDVYVPVWGTFVSTPEVSSDQAVVNIETTIENTSAKSQKITINTTLLSPTGNNVGNSSKTIEVSGNSKANINNSINVANPDLWDIDLPNLYIAKTEVIVNNKIVDNYSTSFGIRTFNFDVDNGFTLNGENMKIKGVCLHHDGGLVGAAVPKEVWRRRLQTLKDGGCNAIRISHNPSSTELLELCDEMGFLVQDEFFDEWDYPKDKRLNMNERHDDYITRGSAEYFQEWAERDLKSTMLAHRNHPSVFQWSIGNEIEWTYPRNKKATGFWDADWSGNYFWNPTPLSPQEIKKRYDKMDALEYNIGETAQKLSKWTKELDATRPVVANCILPSASYVTGYGDALDVIGFSYRRVMYDYGHKHFPNKPLMGTENLCQWHEWKAIMERNFVSGTFLWTGIDYMGEAHHRPGTALRRKGTASGLLDYAGFTKPSYHMMKSLWSEKATLYMSTQKLSKSIYKLDKKGNIVSKKPDAWKQALWYWHDVNDHWNYSNNEKVVVEIISNSPEIELFLNGKSLGTKKLANFEDRIYKWLVPFVNGTLEAKGTVNNKQITTKLITSTNPFEVKLSVDKTTLDADGYDVAHIFAQIFDKDGNPVIADNEIINFNVSGDVKILGVDNGDNRNFQDYQSNTLTTYKGRALLIVQSKTKDGIAEITASMLNKKSNSIKLSIE